ncbi:hypothetical protein IMG5_068280 [Ichthyophthirius multifiliis]|uniref:Clathrin/coatomer adaptor adaptin-like N-terminal domain-containing protein n=1 Tax=Ichthyophthirius multifiliis TaxID=5932 RepID=G0QPI1_ICHMU|nr:hypothetical protein IMG5_068280 [Ichthyophthirius multifiliis]EGR32873.1 hypothetical protein IMG5_068280 [Ichthyophthirius multifiliis]|eukprot:XP_004036859.1 hypothetical protein IMG5_068280 [Ichthyophthirius multifiliis]
MSSSQLTKEMHDLVKQIGETRSKQEEDKIILQEQTKLKSIIKDKSQPIKKQKENLIKSMYIDMLGHDSTFCHFIAVETAQSKNLSMKRLGYLTCCLFLNDQSELLILLVANLQKDLQSKNVHEIVIALTALGKLMNSTIINGILEQVLKLLIHQTDLVRKKAIMVLQKIHQLSPSSIPDYNDKMRKALCDVEPSVMGASLNLYLEAVKEDPNKFKEHTGSFVLILKQIIEHKLPKEFDYSRIPAPWIQIKNLQILAILGKKDQKVSEQIYEILGQALRRSDDTGSKIGFAVTYQCVKTIATIYPYQSLLEQAASAVSRFLTSDNNNLKYLGINALISIVQVNSSYVLEHQRTIMDCLESNDDTLKRETMELLYKMTNMNNVQAIVERLINFLKTSSDQNFRKNLVTKITSLADRHSPDYEWYLKTMNFVFEYGSEYIDNEILNNFLRTLVENFQRNGNEFGQYLIDIYLLIIRKINISDTTFKMISWVIGEIGSATYSNNKEKLDELIQVLLEYITNDFEDKNTRGWMLNALAKLSSCPAFSMQEELAQCFDYYADSYNPEVASRAKEYKILSKYNAALRQSQALVIDPKLNFLNDFIEKAVMNGAKKYEQSKSMKMAYGQTTTQNQQIYFEAKQSDKLQYKNNGDQEEELKLNIKQRIYGPDGVNEIEQPKPLSYKIQENNSNKKSISSKDYQEKPYIEGVKVVRPEINSISSDTYKLNQPSNTVDYRAKIETENPKQKQRDALAQGLFSGIATNTPSVTIYICIHRI